MEYYSENEKGFIIPGIEIQFEKFANERKCLRFVSDILDIRFIQAISTGKIRAQVWLEKNIKKGSGSNKKKHSWVHSVDNTPNRPKKLFTDYEYDYGCGSGWGIRTFDSAPDYSKTNGYVPTEFEITPKNIHEKRIFVYIDLEDIFANMLCIKIDDENKNRCVPNSEPADNIRFIGKKKHARYPIRARIMVNFQGQVLTGESKNLIYLGIARSTAKIAYEFETTDPCGIATVTIK